MTDIYDVLRTIMRQILSEPGFAGYRVSATGGGADNPLIDTTPKTLPTTDGTILTPTILLTGAPSLDQGNNWNRLPQVNPELRGYAESPAVIAAASGSWSVDPLVANVWDITVVGALTIAPAPYTALPPIQTPVGVMERHLVLPLTLILRQTSTIAPTIAGIKWPRGTAPALSTIPGKIDVVQLFTPDSGVTWIGIGSIIGAA